MATRVWKQEVHERDCHKCKICSTGGSKKNPLSVHHRIPVARGGKSNKENCVCWCTICHRAYHKEWGLTISDDFGNPVESRYTSKSARHRKRIKKNKRH